MLKQTVPLIFLFAVQAQAKPGDLISLREMEAIESTELGDVLKNDVCPGTKSKVGTNPIRFMSLTYETTNLNGNPTRASAALLIPATGAKHFSIVSYQHGTTVRRDNAPSQGRKWTEGRVIGACYASQGYAVVAADYLGYGDSTEYHPYIHADSEATAAADALRAAKQAARNLGFEFDGKLFLSGYSQGAHATMALHRYLQEELNSEFTVSASAPMAGPYEPAETIRLVLQNPDWPTSVQAAFLLVAYNKIYALFASLDEAILPKYTANLETLLPGEFSINEVVRMLPVKPEDLLQPAFQKDFLSNPENTFLMALRKNDVYNWKPTAPVMFFHGTIDIQVPTFNSVLAEETMRRLGANTQLVWIEGKDHTSAAPDATARSITWFNSL
jgi:pimeloyl-ACP methyl ester carboxylesterase